jgi:predicted chitinase
VTATLQIARASAAATLAAIDALLAAHTQADAALDLPEPAKFFDHVRGRLWPRMSVSQVSGCERLIAAGGTARLPLSHLAYVLATAYHETAYAMQPVREKGSHAYLDMYDTGAKAKALGNTPDDDDDGQLFCGRGDVQLTGATNYWRATVKLRAIGVLKAHEDLTQTPDLALRGDVSAAVIVHGMGEGWFTGKKMSDYLPAVGRATEAQFSQARRIVNGMDRSKMIAGYALTFQEALRLAGYGR